MPRTPALPPEERRAQILAVAGRVFSSKGFGETRMSDIAVAGGMAQGLVYRYFPSKEALFQALVEESFARLAEAVASLEALPLSDGEKVAFALDGLIRRLRADDDFARRIVLLSQAGVIDNASPEARPALAAARERPYRDIAAILARGQADGSVAAGSPEAMAVLFWTIVKGLAQHRQAFGPDFPAPDADLVRRLFIPQPCPQPRTPS